MFFLSSYNTITKMICACIIFYLANSLKKGGGGVGVINIDYGSSVLVFTLMKGSYGFLTFHFYNFFEKHSFLYLLYVGNFSPNIIFFCSIQLILLLQTRMIM